MIEGDLLMTNDNTSKWEDIANAEANEENELDNQEQQAETVTEPQTDANSALQHPDYEALQKKLTETEMKMHENWEKAVRATAEKENIQRRAERDVASAHKYANEKLINSLLPVIDSLEQALQASADNTEAAVTSMKEGIELTIKLFIDCLEKANVKQIDPIGEAFDPNAHEAMSMQEDPSAKSGTVLMVFQKGYLLNERVIRPARVIVSK